MRIDRIVSALRANGEQVHVQRTPDGPAVGVYLKDGTANLVWCLAPIDDESDDRCAEFLLREAARLRPTR